MYKTKLFFVSYAFYYYVISPFFLFRDFGLKLHVPWYNDTMPTLIRCSPFTFHCCLSFSSSHIKSDRYFPSISWKEDANFSPTFPLSLPTHDIQLEKDFNWDFLLTLLPREDDLGIFLLPSFSCPSSPQFFSFPEVV